MRSILINGANTVALGLGRYPRLTAEVGGARLAHAATVALGGDAPPLYFDKQVPRAANPAALREDLAAELWGYSERAVTAACAGPAAAA